MLSHASIQATAIIVIAVFFVGLWASGEEVKVGWLRFYSAAVFVAVGALTVFDRWLWRTRLLQRLQFVPPDLRGTWKGVLASEWNDPTTGPAPALKTVYLVIRQTVSQVSAALLTDESRSASSLAKTSRADGSVRLDYLYLNQPALRVEHRSRMHRGSTVLDVAGNPAKRLHGRYWTDRDSKGELTFTERRLKYADDFTHAEEMFR